MRCLTDAEIQAVADHEADEGARAHVEGCQSCAALVAAQRLRLAPLESLLASPAALPASLTRRVEEALAAPATVRGATRLRSEEEPRRRWPRAGWGMGLAAAAAAVVILVVLPMMDGPGTVSAADVLAHSLDRLSQPVSSGVELLEYELALEGVPSELMPSEESGTYRIQQLVDHDVPGRYRVSTFGPGGALLSALSEDPAAGRRVSFARVEGRAYRFEFATAAPAPRFSMADLERLHAQACIAVMQASGDSKLSVVENAAGRSYLIQVPPVADAGQGVWDLQEARLLIDAADYRIRELAVRGTLLQKPYSVSYKRTRHEVRPSGEVEPGEFEVPDEPGAFVLRGPGSENLLRDVLSAALRELSQAREAR